MKAIIFDFGGVVSTRGNFDKAKEKFSKIFGVSKDDFDAVFTKNWYLWRDDKINEKRFWDNISNELNFEYNFEQVKKITRNITKINNSMVSLIKEIRNKYKIYILSNHAREWFNHTIKKDGLDELFDGIFTSFEAQVSKPEKEIYLKFLEKFGCEASECVFIDDKPENIDAAKSLGFNGIVFDDFEQLKQELRRLGI